MQPIENAGVGKDTPSLPDDASWALWQIYWEVRDLTTWHERVGAYIRERDRAIRAEERERLLTPTPEMLVAMARAMTVRTTELYGDLPPENPDLTLTTEIALAALAALRRIENIGESKERTSARDGRLSE